MQDFSNSEFATVISEQCHREDMRSHVHLVSFNIEFNSPANPLPYGACVKDIKQGGENWHFMSVNLSRMWKYEEALKTLYLVIQTNKFINSKQTSHTDYDQQITYATCIISKIL